MTRRHNKPQPPPNDVLHPLFREPRAKRIMWAVLDVVSLTFYTLVILACFATVTLGILGEVFGIGPAK